MRDGPGLDLLLFRRQFLAGATPVRFRETWRVTKFANLYVSCHPDLEVNKVATDNSELLGLGHILDPADVTCGTDGVLKRIIAASRTFADFEQAISALGGCWLIFAKIGVECRLYPDAAGMKSAFYTPSSKMEHMWVASQPRLLHELFDHSVDTHITSEFLRSKYQNSWPGEITPYVNVRQLLPNHYLELKVGSAHRFWPKECIDSLDIKVGAERVRSIMNRLIASAGSRKDLYMPLTGGHDSRVLLACAGTLRDHIKFFTVVDPDTELHDVVIPRKLARMFKIDYSVLRTQPADNEFTKLYWRNTSYMLSDPSNIKVYTYFNKFEDAFILTGAGAEIARCFYYGDGNHPLRVSAENLAALSGYEGNPVAVRSFASWLTDVPTDVNINLLDLFYWEHRVGNWGAMIMTGKDMVCETIPPFNCRQLLEAALGVCQDARKRPYHLVRKILEITEPDSLSIPFNTCLKERIFNTTKAALPWKFQNFIFRQRMKFAGLSHAVSKPKSMEAILTEPTIKIGADLENRAV